MKTRCVVFCGSRSWTSEALIARELRRLGKGTLIRVGGARGADKLSEACAGTLGFKVDLVEAQWTKYGRSAGFERNTRMLEEDPTPWLVKAFWDGQSRGTLDTVIKAIKRDIQVKVIFWDGCTHKIRQQHEREFKLTGSLAAHLYFKHKAICSLDKEVVKSAR